MGTNGTSPERKYDVAIVGGGGHVGLPLALVFADYGLNVLVYDINKDTLDKVGRGIVPFAEHGAEELLAKILKTGRLGLTADPAQVADAKKHCDYDWNAG